jgi:hypothetical protein
MPPRRNYKQFCETCGKELKLKSYGKYNKRFCCFSCSVLNGERHGAYKGGRFINKNGYVMVLIAGSGKYELEHRRVIEHNIGRKLLSSETVHHINGIKTDNRIENLTIIGLAEHGTLHKQERCEKNQKWEFVDSLPDEVCVGKTVSIRRIGHRAYIGKICEVCGKKFWTRTDYKSRTCSNSCGHRKVVV